ncbi:hypothetical protein SAMN02800692_1851 [Luteibacter sp. UNC138MFCol5.1]|nr:hypothetical protein SAMN02800692_1851 [Luteibacter sp. UNC138MFCol5.1]
MDFVVVLDPTHAATRAIAAPGCMPWHLTPVGDEPPFPCPTVRCKFVDASVPNFMRVSGVIGEEDLDRLVWIPLSAVITVFERDESTRVDSEQSSTMIH